MSNRDFPQRPPAILRSEEARRPETLRPVAQDPVGDDAQSFIKPVRWPLIIGVTLLTLAAFMGVIFVVARSSGLSGVNATLAAAAQRNETERESQNQAPLRASPSDTAAVEHAVGLALGPALRACGLSIPNEPVRAETSVSSTGFVTGVSVKSAPFAGSRSGECLSQKLVGLRVPGYQGIGGLAVVSAQAR